MVYIRMIVLLGYPARLVRVAQRLIVGGLSVGAVPQVQAHYSMRLQYHILEKEK